MKTITLTGKTMTVVLCYRGGCGHPHDHGFISPLCEFDGCPCGESVAVDERIMNALRRTVHGFGGWVADDSELKIRGIVIGEHAP